MSEETSPLYQENEKVLVHHQNNVYEAKVLKYEFKVDPKNKTSDEKKHYYFIHYIGWKDKWDEWVDQNRLLKHNEQNLELMMNRGKTRSSSGLTLQSPSPSSTQQQKKKSNSKASDSESSSSSTNKRKRTEPISPLNIDIHIPDTLKKVLVDDWNFITNDKSIVSLPRSPTVKSLLDDFVNNNKESDINSEQQVVDGIGSYFNKALGCLLLYKFERHQYSEMLKQHPDKPLSEIYGAEHLLRLFVKLPELISTSGMDEHTVETLARTFEDLIKYMERNQSTLFLKEYSPVTSYYNRLASN